MQKKDISIDIGRKKYVTFEFVFSSKIKINKENKEKTYECIYAKGVAETV